jgi:endogenous inhibitor of DNA gyrase (YacG/DUF329 family)
MFEVECPKCGAKSSLSFEQSSYEGPFRCWKCKGTFIASIDNNKLEWCKPISKEEFEKYIE